MEISDRLKLIIKSHSLTASAFADKIGVQRSSISHLLSGRNKPSLDVIQKILVNFPKVNALWLISGENSVPQQSPSPQEKSVSPVVSKQKKMSDLLENRDLESIVTFYKDGSFKMHYPKE